MAFILGILKKCALKKMVTSSHCFTVKPQTKTTLNWPTSKSHNTFDVLASRSGYCVTMLQ